MQTPARSENNEWAELKALQSQLYVGAKRRLDGDEAGAVAPFELGVALGVEDSHEHWSARAEIERLTK